MQWISLSFASTSRFIFPDGGAAMDFVGLTRLVPPDVATRNCLVRCVSAGLGCLGVLVSRHTRLPAEFGHSVGSPFMVGIRFSSHRVAPLCKGVTSHCMDPKRSTRNSIFPEEQQADWREDSPVPTRARLKGGAVQTGVGQYGRVDAAAPSLPQTVTDTRNVPDPPEKSDH